MLIKKLGHMIKVTAMPIYGKIPLKVFFSGATGPISTKIGTKHRRLKYYNVFVNYDPLDDLDLFHDKVNIGRLCI